MYPNMKLNQIFAVALAVLATLIVPTESACDENAMTQCAAPMINLGQRIIHLTEEEFTRACSQMDDVLSCIRQRGCTDEDVQLTLQGLEDGFNYICTDMRQVILSNPTCTRRQGLMQQLSACATEFREAVKDTSNKKTICSALHNVMACNKNQFVSAGCSQDVTTVFVTYYYKVMQPVARHFNCNLERSGAKLSAPHCKSPSWTLLGAALISSAILLLKGA